MLNRDAKVLTMQGLPLIVLMRASKDSNETEGIFYSFVDTYIIPLLKKYDERLVNWSKKKVIEGLIGEITQLKKQHAASIEFAMSLAIAYERNDKIYLAGFEIGDSHLVVQRSGGDTVQLIANPEDAKCAFEDVAESNKIKNIIFKILVRPRDELLVYSGVNNEVICFPIPSEDLRQELKWKYFDNSKQTYEAAQNKLKAECERYLQHNKQEMESLKPNEKNFLGYEPWYQLILLLGEETMAYKEKKILDFLINFKKELIEKTGYRDSNTLTYAASDPYSTKIYCELENIRLSTTAVLASNFNKFNTDVDLKRLDSLLRQVYPALLGFIKGLAVKEISELLAVETKQEGPDLISSQPMIVTNYKKALEDCAAQLNKGKTAIILGLDRQSNGEKAFKYLSVISILVGVGIFTTAFLMAKRFYDSKYTSVNFFKPLTKNLEEDIRDFQRKVLTK